MLDKTNPKLLPYELMQLYRHRAGWTQLHLAQELGLSSKRMVQYWEAGTYLPKVDSLKKVIAVLVKHHIFLGGQELQEAQQLWKAVKEASDTLLESLTPYPVFDEGWFESLLAGQAETKPPPRPDVLLKEAPNLPNNLPVQLTSFIGREQEIAEIKELLKSNRLLTLTGAGGSGKTRLSLALAEKLLGDFSEGVYFVGLENVTERTSLLSTLAQTLAVKESATQDLLSSLKNYLKERQLLLVLDNFEQLVEQGAILLPELHKATSNLKIVVTSRERLHLSQEKEYLVEPLALPQSGKSAFTFTPENLTDYAAVALFVERARTVKPGFCLTEENAMTVAEICQELDGLPLAIELAAARIKLLGPVNLLERLADKLKVLVGGARDLAPRQQTLRGALDWSYELLAPAEQQLFRRVAIFAGGCTLGSLEAVCNSGGDLGLEVLDGLEALVDKSLLKQREDATGEVRFRMLPIIREYGLEKLAEQAEGDAVEKAYLTYFVSLAEKLESRVYGVEQLITLKKLDSEYDNLREGLYRALTKPFPRLTWQLGGALGSYWLRRGYYREGREYLERVLTLSGEEVTKAARVKVLNRLGNLALEQGDYQLVRAYAEESLPLGRETGNKEGILNALNLLGAIAWFHGEYFKAQEYFEENLILSKELDHKPWETGSLLVLGLSVMEQGDYAKAQNYFEEGLALGLKSGYKEHIAAARNYLGFIAIKQENYPKALELLEEGLSLRQEYEGKLTTFMSLLGLGPTATKLGDYPKARSYLEESLVLSNELGDKRSMSYTLVSFIFLVREQGKSAKAEFEQEDSKFLKSIACLGGATATLLSATKLVLIQPWRSYYEQGLEVAREGLGGEAFGAAFGEGQAMSLEEITRFALAIEIPAKPVASDG